jgi:predicted Zn-dependent protease with MMP-like domain
MDFRSFMNASAEDIEAMARATLDGLPRHFSQHLGDIVLQVQDYADAETLAAVGLTRREQLSGIYQGIPLHLKSIEQSGTLPDRIKLFRKPILSEWRQRGDISLEQLVAHVTIHEVGHHFGLSDDDMHALEDAAD